MSDISNALGGVGLLRASLARTGRWAASLGLVAGIVSDILNPLAPFAAYIAMVAAVAAAIIASAIVFRLVLTTRAMPALVFATTTAAIAGGIYALQQNRSADNGVIASLIPAVAELQQSMGIVAARVEKIEQTVTETQQTVTETQKAVDGVKQSTDQIATRQDAQTEQIGEVKQSTDEIAAKQDAQAKQVGELQKSTEQIAVSIDAIAKGFAALAAQGSTIADPKRPDEFYHNARVQELGGDMVNARRSYLAFASFDIDAIDPYQRFATLLRVQDGRAGAREVFGELAGRASRRRSSWFTPCSSTMRSVSSG
jgi:uncharacterized protein YoxC